MSLELMVFTSDTTMTAITERLHLYKILGLKPSESLSWAVLVKDNKRGFASVSDKSKTLDIVESLPLDNLPVQANIEKLQRFYEDKYSQPVRLTIKMSEETERMLIDPTIDQNEEIKFTSKAMIDKDGNQIYKEGNSFYLKLERETRKRRLGVINTKAGRLQIHKIRKKHLMEKIQGYGFNYLFLKNAKSFQTIELYDEISQWIIPKQFILENGQFLHFKESGFELQIFISLKKLDTFKAEAGV